MKKYVTVFGLLFIVSTAGAQTVKVSCDLNGFKMELIPTQEANSFRLQTTHKNGNQELSQPMTCLLATSQNVFSSAECNQSILNVKFIKNADGLFSITHEFIIPGKPELKDPSAGSYGEKFDCKLVNLSEEEKI